jgi:hypothetical protein
MTTQASELTRIEECDLCRAVRMTPWYHEDDVCWIAECDVCDVPMVVWRWHGTACREAVEHMRAHLHEVATAQIAGTTIGRPHAHIPDHRHRPMGGFFARRRARLAL